MECSVVEAQLDEADHALIGVAQETIRRFYKPDWNQVAAAVRTRSGRTFTSVNLDTHVGVAGVCAEPIAIGQAILAAQSEADREIASVVAVRGFGGQRPPERIEIVSPCGKCRELIADYGPEAHVLVPSESGPSKIAIAHLLPRKYNKHP